MSLITVGCKYQFSGFDIMQSAISDKMPPFSMYKYQTWVKIGHFFDTNRQSNNEAKQGRQKINRNVK